MEFQVTITPAKKYYTEAYTELISLTRLKKWEPYIAILMILVGVIVYYFNIKNLKIFPFIISAAGFYELYKSFYERNKWLKDRLDSNIAGQQINFIFNEKTIKHSGPFSNGEMSWSGFKSIIKTRKGIVLRPETGVSIYLPDYVFDDRSKIEFILSMKKKV